MNEREVTSMQSNCRVNSELFVERFNMDLEH